MIELDYPISYYLSIYGTEKALKWANRLLRPKSRVRTRSMREIARICGTRAISMTPDTPLFDDVSTTRVYGLRERAKMFK